MLLLLVVDVEVGVDVVDDVVVEVDSHRRRLGWLVIVAIVAFSLALA